MTRLISRMSQAVAIVCAVASVSLAQQTPASTETAGLQALNPCALITTDDIQPLAAKTSVADGLMNSLPAFGYVACRYTWGAGIGHFKLDVVVTDPTRMFPGGNPDQVKQRLLESVRAGTDDAVISEVGEAAVFRPDSIGYASATALVKGRILQVHLDGLFAPDKKDQVIGLLKSAASRL